MTSRGSKDVYRHSDKFAHVINRCMVHSNLQRDRDNFLDSLQFDSLVGPSKMGWGGGATYFRSPSAFSRRAVVSYWRKYVHEVLVNRLGGLSLPRKSVVRLTDRPDMTLDVYHGRKITMQHQQMVSVKMSGCY